MDAQFQIRGVFDGEVIIICSVRDLATTATLFFDNREDWLNSGWLSIEVLFHAGPGDWQYVDERMLRAVFKP